MGWRRAKQAGISETGEQAGISETGDGTDEDGIVSTDIAAPSAASASSTPGKDRHRAAGTLAAPLLLGNAHLKRSLVGVHVWMAFDDKVWYRGRILLQYATHSALRIAFDDGETHDGK